VTGDDHARLDRDDLVEWIGNQAFMRIAHTSGVGHCAALSIESGRYLCTVYERRPQVCRDLERGSGPCEGERHAKGPRLVVLQKV
jgi:hypothetical protein